MIMAPIDYNDPNDPWRTPGYDPYKGMSDKQKFLASLGQVIGIVLGTVVAMILCALLFSSCTTTKYVTVPMPEYHTDTLHMIKVQHDSLVLKDSIYIHDKGDTVLIEKWHTQWRDRWRTDTVYKSRVDSVMVPCPIPPDEPKKTMTWWQQTRMHLGDMLLVAALLALLVWVVRWKTRI